MRFLLFDEGTVETLAYFSKRIAKELKRLGHEVLVFDIQDDTRQMPELIAYLKNRTVVLLTFNFGGLQREAIFYDEEQRLLWNQYEVLCVNIIVDHPLYYYKELNELPNRYLQFCIDEGHAEYMKNFYPRVTLGKTMPLAGSAYNEKSGEYKKIAERTYEVSFTGNYTPPEEFEQYITRAGLEYEQFYRGILNEFREHPERELNQVFISHIEREMGKLPSSQMTQAVHSLMFLDMWIRFCFRGEAIRLLTEAGITVHTFGAGWNLLKTEGKSHLICHGSQVTEGCLDALGNTKLSLNVMPWFKRGAHDRIYNSMINGAVCITDTSEYLITTLQNGENAVFYELSRLGDLPEQVELLLHDEDKMQRIADGGYRHVIQTHTWEQYTEELLKQINAAL